MSNVYVHQIVETLDVDFNNQVDRPSIDAYLFLSFPNEQTGQKTRIEIMPEFSGVNLY